MKSYVRNFFEKFRVSFRLLNNIKMLFMVSITKQISRYLFFEEMSEKQGKQLKNGLIFKSRKIPCLLSFKIQNTLMP